MDSQGNSVALVVGITGMVGISLGEALKKSTCRGGPWKVYGVARRGKPTWFPESIVDEYIQLDALNSEETRKKLGPIASQITHLFWVALQNRSTEEENIAANSAMFRHVLETLTEAKSCSLRHVTLQTGTKNYLGPIDLHHVPEEIPFREEAERLKIPHFYYVLEDILASYNDKFTWSVHRASLILGASSRSIFNVLLYFASYAAICKKEGLPFNFPGSRYCWENFCDASDADVLAEQHIWAATTEKAKNQAFNCSNGDVFTWKNFWKALAEALDIEFVPYSDQFNWVAFMKEKRAVWDDIVEENRLEKTTIDEIVKVSGFRTVLSFNFQHVCSMNKSKDFGFFGYADTLKSIKKWIEKLKKMNIIPK